LFYQLLPGEFTQESRRCEPGNLSLLASIDGLKKHLLKIKKLKIMAHANNSITTGKFRGSLGKELVFREWQGKTIVAKAPKARTGDPTPAQLEAQEKFFMASRYAKAVRTNVDQSLALAYSTVLRPRQNVYSRALEDFLSPPVVKLINRSNYYGAEGETILVRAIDDFRVKKVTVKILDPNGIELESGDAVQNMNGIDWTYSARSGIATLDGCTIKAIATDVPDNEGTLELVL
jgi:hypothetical protein